MQQEIHQDITVTSKGQITLPVRIRKALKLGARRKIRMEVNMDGVVTMRPLPDVMSFYGALKSEVPYSESEKSAAREAMARRALKPAKK